MCLNKNIKPVIRNIQEDRGRKQGITAGDGNIILLYTSRLPNIIIVIECKLLELLNIQINIIYLNEMIFLV